MTGRAPQLSPARTELVLAGYLFRADGVSPRFSHSFTMLSVREALTGRLIGFEDHESSANISAGRNDIVRRFLDHPLQPDWLWMVDTDMTFDTDIIDRLITAADVDERPIVGGLCFTVGAKDETVNATLSAELELEPTIYIVRDGKMHRLTDYPTDTVIPASSTGAACVLIHRRVFEDPRWQEDGHPFPWFRETVAWGKPCSEDQRFFLQASIYGYPTFIDTGAKTGHHKSFVADEDGYMRQRSAGLVPPPATERVAVLVPVMKRPQNAEPFMRSLTASTGLATVYAIYDEDDTETRDAWKQAGAQTLPSTGSTFAIKINDGYRATECEPWLFLVGDDVRFHPGWYDHAIQAAKGAAVVGTNDLGNARVMRAKHATHMLVRRSYVDERGFWDGPGVVCHEGYSHWYVDDELVTAAKTAGVWSMALASKVEHLHPLFGKGENDAVYELGEKNHDADRRIFEARAEKFTRA